MSRRLHIGLFASEGDLVSAARECRTRALTIVDAYSPYPLHGIDPVLEIPRSRLTIVCFVGGLAGLALGLGFQYWSSAVDWPLNVGGKPFDSLPAFIPVGFEMTVLFAGLLTVFALLVRSRLWPGKRKTRELAGVTDDHFALIVAEDDARLRSSELVGILTNNGAVRTWEEVEQ